MGNTPVCRQGNGSSGKGSDVPTMVRLISSRVTVGTQVCQSPWVFPAVPCCFAVPCESPGGPLTRQKEARTPNRALGLIRSPWDPWGILTGPDTGLHLMGTCSAPPLGFSGWQAWSCCDLDELPPLGSFPLCGRWEGTGKETWTKST